MDEKSSQYVVLGTPRNIESDNFLKNIGIFFCRSRFDAGYGSNFYVGPKIPEKNKYFSLYPPIPEDLQDTMMG